MSNSRTQSYFQHRWRVTPTASRAAAQWPADGRRRPHCSSRSEGAVHHRLCGERQDRQWPIRARHACAYQTVFSRRIRRTDKGAASAISFPEPPGYFATLPPVRPEPPPVYECLVNTAERGISTLSEAASRDDSLLVAASNAVPGSTNQRTCKWMVSVAPAPRLF